ncbi:MAG TPA: MxaK protein [Methylibium sp.]|nr:MxaK protein [Methylibium sp.]
MALKHILLAPRTRLRTLFALLALSLAVAAAAGWQWWRLGRDDALAAAGGVAALPVEQTLAAPTLRFARARELAAAGDFEGALALYRTLYTDRHLGVTARYNNANLLMREAQRLRDADGAGQAVALIELAKQGYREVLRAEPRHWDARYNYERAQRLQPDPEDATPSIGGPRNDAERASITIRGVPQGLP